MLRKRKINYNDFTDLKSELIYKTGAKNWITCIKKIKFYEADEFPDTFFSMCRLSDIKYIPESAYLQATQKHILNIPLSLVPRFGLKITLFRSKINYFTNKQIGAFTMEQLRATFCYFSEKRIEEFILLKKMFKHVF